MSAVTHKTLPALPATHLEAVPEVDVQDLAADPVEQQVGRVPVAQPQHVAHHRHHRQRAREVVATVEPDLGGRGLGGKKGRFEEKNMKVDLNFSSCKENLFISRKDKQLTMEPMLVMVMKQLFS